MRGFGGALYIDLCRLSRQLHQGSWSRGVRAGIAKILAKEKTNSRLRCEKWRPVFTRSKSQAVVVVDER